MSSGQYLSPPFLYINLGCHMIFVIKSRLIAQKIDISKGSKIISQISNATFNQKLISGMLAPQKPIHITYFKTIFSSLAQTSVMKMDQTSMDKLFFLMAMSVKKEFLFLTSPLEMYAVTLGNMENVIPELKNQPNQMSYRQCIKIFKGKAREYTFMQYMQIRQFLLRMLQPYQTKVVAFIEVGYQQDNGRMVVPLRNSHNEKSIGSAQNQSDLTVPQQISNSGRKLFYEDWLNWKSSLVIDHVQEYEKSSSKRRASITTADNESNPYKVDSSKELMKFLQMNNESVSKFQFRMDDVIETPNQVSQGEMKSVEKKGKTNVVGLDIVQQINAEFEKVDLKEDKEEDQEPDLLDLMDN